MHSAKASSSTSNAVVVSAPQSLTKTSTPSLQDTFKKDRSKLFIILDLAIGSLSLTKEAVPIDAMKPVLILICGILVMIRDTIINDEALVDVCLYCADICYSLKRATSGMRDADIHETTLAAIVDMHRVIENMHTKVAKASRKSRVSRLFASKINKETIAGWQASLDRSVRVFNAEVALFTSIISGQINDKVDDVAQDVREIKELVRTNVVKPASKTTGVPPPAPKIFFGRDDLVEKVVSIVTQGKHVALIGLGGIGKTSISKKALNNPAIAAHFAEGLHFISCDGFAVSLEAFVTRIANAIGTTVTSTDPLPSLSAFLRSLPAPILIVLDNAESVLDADDNESRALISQAIEEIGSHLQVSLILTTRSKSLPHNLEWNRIRVEPLDPDAARDTFFAAYKHEPVSSAADPLLIAVGYHALSINLLAVAGDQNEWSILELHQRWEEEQTRVLDLDDSNRMQSLSASIKLSLNSRTLRLLGDKALEVLQVIAFLPEGVDKNKLPELFPSVSNIRSITDAMNRLSLTYLKGADFITMLAPIRLYIQRTSPPIPPLLPHTQTFYFEYLSSMDGLHAKWIAFEDDNVETLITYSMEISDDLETAAKACYDFIYALHWNKPRTTTLLPLVRALPEVDSLTLWKAQILRTLGWLADELGRYVEALELLESARKIATTYDHKSLAAQCAFSVGKINDAQNNYSAAEQSYEGALKEYRDIGDENGVAECKERLGDVQTQRGNLVEASRYLSDALKYWEKDPDSHNAAYVRVRLGALAFKQGNYTEGRNHFDIAIAIFIKLGVDAELGWCFLEYGMEERESRNWVRVLDLFERAEEYYSRTNNIFQGARCQLQIAWVYLYQRELALAQQYIERAKRGYEIAGSAYHIAHCLRGLGELAYLKAEDRYAERLFADARNLYGSVGRKPIREGVQLLDDLRWDYWYLS